MLAHGKCKVPTADTGANITVSIIKQLNALCSSTDSPIILVPTKKRSHFGDPQTSITVTGITPVTESRKLNRFVYREFLNRWG